MPNANLDLITCKGIPVYPALPPWLAMTQGRFICVKPSSGSDGNDGYTPETAVKTMAQALTLATANQNDIVLVFAESNTAASTTDYQSSTLTWSKDMVHIIGVNSGGPVAQRSRIAFTSTYDTASNLMTVSANGCFIANMHLFAGVAGTNPTGCLSVTGSRNRFENCHIAGIGHDNNDIANAYSLSVAGSENLFQDCTIGLDTVTRGTADNAELVLASGAARNVFKDCLFLSWAGANTHQFVKRAASASDRFTLFKRCTFLNFTLGGGASMLEAFDLTAGGSPAGVLVLDNCAGYGIAEWEASTATGILFVNMAAGSATDGGVGVAYTAG